MGTMAEMNEASNLSTTSTPGQFKGSVDISMAGDWIKMRKVLGRHPKVFELSALLELHRHQVIGMLHEVWSWADDHSIDGNAVSVTGVTLDRIAECDGFAAALRKVGSSWSKIILAYVRY